jgi:hypothetical protein
VYFFFFYDEGRCAAFRGGRVGDGDAALGLHRSAEPVAVQAVKR